MAFENTRRIAAGKNRQKVLLLVLILVLTGVVLYRETGGPGNPKKGVENTGRLSSATSNSADPALMIDKLKETPQETDEEKRNLFAFYEPPPPPRVVAAVQEEEEEPEIVCGDNLCMEGETYEDCPSDCRPPPPPEIALKYIGYLSQSGGEVVFLTDGKDVYMGRENDIIANKYRVLKITDQNVELGYLNLNQSRTIPFAGNGGS